MYTIGTGKDRVSARVSASVSACVSARVRSNKYGVGDILERVRLELSIGRVQ